VASCNEASPWSRARTVRSGTWSRSVAVHVRFAHAAWADEWPLPRSGAREHRPLLAPPWSAHRGAGPCCGPWAPILAKPRPPPQLRSASRRGSNVAGARHRRSDRLLPATPLASRQAPVCPETRNPLRWPSTGSVFRPDPPAPPYLPASIVSSPRHPTRPEGVYFSYGPVCAGAPAVANAHVRRVLVHSWAITAP